MKTIKGIKYDPILTLEKRVASMLEDIETKDLSQFRKEFKEGAEFGFSIVKIWLKDEIEAIKNAKAESEAKNA